MKKLQLTTNLAIPMMIGLGSPMLHAQPVQASTTALYLQYGSAEHSTDSWTGGVMLPWNWSTPLGPGRMTGFWDLSLSRWSAGYRGADRSTWVLGAQPTVRWRPAQGLSPWFLQAGLGVSYAINHRFISDHKEFSTRYNFASHIGIGYLFGEQQKNEISLRFEHQSNAGIKRPNPGENFLQLRYTRHF